MLSLDNMCVLQTGWLRSSSRSNCHSGITQIKCGQATHLDYMCTCAVSNPLTGSIALAGGCAKSITQADPWCWTSWKSCLVSWLHLPAHLFGCCLAARWPGWGSGALLLPAGYKNLKSSSEESRDQPDNELWRFISLTQWKFSHFVHNCVANMFALAVEGQLGVNCLISQRRQTIMWWCLSL